MNRVVFLMDSEMYNNNYINVSYINVNINVIFNFKIMKI